MAVESGGEDEEGAQLEPVDGYDNDIERNIAV